MPSKPVRGVDALGGGPGADYFDCGLGVDTILDFNVSGSEGDIRLLNCEK